MFVNIILVMKLNLLGDQSVQVITYKVCSSP